MLSFNYGTIELQVGLISYDYFYRHESKICNFNAYYAVNRLFGFIISSPLINL